MVKNIIGRTTSPESLDRLTIELYEEQIYVNASEVMAFARELQELREKLLEVK